MRGRVCHSMLLLLLMLDLGRGLVDLLMIVHDGRRTVVISRSKVDHRRRVWEWLRQLEGRWCDLGDCNVTVTTAFSRIRARP